MIFKKPIDQMTIEELLAEAGDPTVTHSTYLYLALNGYVKAIEKADRDSIPADQNQMLGYAQRLLRATGQTGRPWHSSMRH